LLKASRLVDEVLHSAGKDLDNVIVTGLEGVVEVPETVGQAHLFH
jgi:hypothetical protein